MTTYDSIKIRKARRDVIKLFTDLLTHNAGDAERIGKRVQIIKFALDRNEPGAEKAKDFAKRLGCSESRVSNAVCKLLREVDAIVNDVVSGQDPAGEL